MHTLKSTGVERRKSALSSVWAIFWYESEEDGRNEGTYVARFKDHDGFQFLNSMQCRYNVKVQRITIVAIFGMAQCKYPVYKLSKLNWGVIVDSIWFRRTAKSVHENRELSNTTEYAKNRVVFIKFAVEFISIFAHFFTIATLLPLFIVYD